MNSPNGSSQHPQSPPELAECLASAAGSGQSITLGGRFTKRAMAGPMAQSDVTISTAGLTRILQYEPRDLTISVESGALYSDVARTLARHKQMIPLDPPFSETATIGGVLAANCSGPRRRLFGTARDLVIGMTFATLEGKLVQSGGMVVKNVAGLDMAKLMIGSFGTLGAIAIANFKLLPIPVVARTFLLAFDSIEPALEARNRILQSVLQPASIDLLNPEAAARVGFSGFLLALQFGGNAAVIERCQREIPAVGAARTLEGFEEAEFWRRVQNFTPDFLQANPQAAVARASSTLMECGEVLASFQGPALARAGSGVSYGYFPNPELASDWMISAGKKGWKAVVEFAPEDRKASMDLWPAPGGDFEIMKKIKHMFDPQHLLNRGRLYNHL